MFEIRLHQISEKLIVAEESINQKLPVKYYNLIDVFDRSKAQKLSLHKSYDHKIKFESGKEPLQNCLYPLSGFKFQKVEEYLEDNLKKRFIFPNTAPSTSPVLFV